MALEKIGDEHLRLLHVVCICPAKEADTFRLVRFGGEEQKDGGDYGQRRPRHAGLFKVNAPCQQQQGAIQRVTDVFVNAARDQTGRLFKRQQGWVAFPFFDRLSLCLQKVDSVSQRNERDQQQAPRDDLIPRERSGKPKVRVEQEQTENAFPRDESRKPV